MALVQPESEPEPIAETVVLDASRNQQYATWDRERILPATSVLLESLPFDLFPYATERSYAHVLNVLATHWTNQRLFIEAATAFLHNNDWPRQGFPRLVFFEILSLVAYHGSLCDLGHLDTGKLNLKMEPGPARLGD